MKKYKFKIGDCVEVYASMVPVYRDGKRLISRVPIYEPKKGIICGMKRRVEGKIVGSNHYGLLDDYDPPYLNPEKVILLYQVKQGMLNVPMEVLEEDIKFIPAFQIPMLFSEWNKRERERLSEYSKHFPRDEKGRFK